MFSKRLFQHYTETVLRLDRHSIENFKGFLSQTQYNVSVKREPSIAEYYYYRYSALGPVWAETRAQSEDWYSSGMLHPGQVLMGRLPLLSPAF
jgi:hypothetical protein